MLKIQKLDKRFAGYLDFQYRVNFVGYRQDRISNFLKIREWCWTNWGPGCERNFCEESIHKPVPWAWHNEGYNDYIYLKDDALLTHFQLTWM